MSHSRNYCAVDGCKSQRKDEKLSFFKLPKDEEKRNTWIEIIGRPDLLSIKTKPESHVVCSLHFDKSMIKNIPQLKPDAVPTKSIQNQPSTSSHNTNEDCKNESTQTEELLTKVESEVTTEDSDMKLSCVQTTPKIIESKTTLLAQALSSDTPRKRELSGEYKVKASQLTAKDPQDVYEPALWHYKEMNFLENVMDPQLGQTEGEGEGDPEQPSVEVKIEEGRLDSDYYEQYQVEYDDMEDDGQISSYSNQMQPSTSCAAAARNSDANCNDEIIGKSIGVQLKDIDKKQKVIAMKLISDAIYYANLGQLKETSFIQLDKEQLDKPNN